MPSANPSSTTATLTYFVAPEDGSRAFRYVNADPVTGINKTNYTRKEHEMVIENVRGSEDQYTLDRTGFQFLKAPAKHTTFANDEEIKSEYYQESIELLKGLTGASRIVIFDHTIRRNRPGLADTGEDARGPVPQTHVDQTEKAAIARVHRHLPESDVPGLLEKRFQIINLWRPIHVPALEWPLALCDYQSVIPKKDCLEVALIYPSSEGETYGILYNPDHKWKYLRDMTTEEAVLIKCYDSIQDGSVAVFTPHTGFSDPTSPADAPHRESIELRALVFYD